MKKHKLHYAWMILLGAALIRGISGPGINGSSGVFLSPVAEDLGVGIGQLSIYLSVSSAASLLWLPVAGALFDKGRVKVLVVVGVLLQTLPFIALGFMRSVWAWYLLAVPLAMGAAFLVNLLGPVLVRRWFQKNVGVAMGLLMMVTSLVGAVAQPLLTSTIAGRGWRFSYVIFGVAAMVAMLVIGLTLLKDRPEEKGLLPLGAGETGAKEPLVGVTAKAGLRSPAFYALVFFMAVLTGFAAFQQHVTTFGLNMGFALKHIGAALSVSMIGSAVGAVAIGFLSDRLGVLKTSIGVLVAGFAAVLLFFLRGDSFIVFALATFLHGLASAAIGVVAPLLVSSFFGNRAYEKLLSGVMLGAPLASIVLTPLYGFIYDRFGSYDLVLRFLLAMLLLAAILLVAGSKNSKKLLKRENKQ